MGGAIGLAIVLAAMAYLVATHGERSIGGLAPDEVASLAASGALALVIAGWVVHEFRGRWMDGVRAVVLWTAILLGFVGLYAYRYEAQDVAGRLLGELAPGRLAVTPSGEVVIHRRADGSFVVAARIQDHDARFIFDTGASAVVLTAEGAASAGYRPVPADYSVPVFTANGRTMAAPIVIDRLAVGPIEERRVKALVARPGVLRENLLGMTFLERLGSYEVRNNRLILRGRGTTT